MLNSIKNAYSTIWFCGLIGLTLLLTFSYHPSIMLEGEDALEKGTVLTKYINLLFIVIWLLKFNLNKWLQSKIIRLSFVIILICLFTSLLTMSIFGRRISDNRAIIISVVALLIGWQADFSKKAFVVMLLLYSISAIFVGMSQVFVNGSGFVIGQYFMEQKNSLGVILATASVILFGLSLQAKKKWEKISLLAFLFFGILVLLTLRARLSTLTTFFVIGFVFLQKNKKKNKGFGLFVSLAVILIVIVVLPESVKDYVYQSFVSGYEEGDITSDRMHRNRAAWDFISQNLWYGNLLQEGTVHQIHNYPIRILYSYGIMFSLPILFYYFYLWVVGIKKVLNYSFNINNLGCVLLLIPFIVSLGEPTFPFGPGTASAFNFIVFGFSLKQIYNQQRLLQLEKNVHTDES